MKNVYLIGMPGCGKSTIGKIISSEIKMNFVDLDDYIVKMCKKTIPELFEVGEPHFREMETKALDEISKKDNTIVATGGGIVTVPENISIMKSGKVIFIHTEPEQIIKNCSLEGRPLLKDKNKIFELYEKRYNLYISSADYVVENSKSIEDTIDKIMGQIKKEM